MDEVWQIYGVALLAAGPQAAGRGTGPILGGGALRAQLLWLEGDGGFGPPLLQSPPEAVVVQLDLTRASW